MIQGEEKRVGATGRSSVGQLSGGTRMMGTQACCLCGQRTSMSGASDSAECNSAGRTDSKSVFLANPRFICSPSPTRLTINECYLSQVPCYYIQCGFSSQSFWKRGSFRRGSNMGSSRRSAGVSGKLSESSRSIVSARARGDDFLEARIAPERVPEGQQLGVASGVRRARVPLESISIL